MKQFLHSPLLFALLVLFAGSQKKIDKSFKTGHTTYRMPRGQKECPNCKTLIGARAANCNHCGTVFRQTKTKKQAKPFFKERKEFVKRMLNGEKSQDMRLDIIVATKVFEWFDNNIDFLSKVKPPFKFNGSIKYFRSQDGRDYLTRKYKEFQYNPQNHEEFVEGNEKIGEDIVKPKTRSLREFLNDSKN